MLHERKEGRSSFTAESHMTRLIKLQPPHSSNIAHARTHGRELSAGTRSSNSSPSPLPKEALSLGHSLSACPEPKTFFWDRFVACPCLSLLLLLTLSHSARCAVPSLRAHTATAAQTPRDSQPVRREIRLPAFPCGGPTAEVSRALHGAKLQVWGLI